jgi:hypothetical protein
MRAKSWESLKKHGAGGRPRRAAIIRRGVEAIHQGIAQLTGLKKRIPIARGARWGERPSGYVFSPMRDIRIPCPRNKPNEGRQFRLRLAQKMRPQRCRCPIFGVKVSVRMIAYALTAQRRN